MIAPALALTGLFLDLLIIGLLWLGFFATLLHFGPGALDGYRSKCPACGNELLQRVIGPRQPGRLHVYRCAGCGAGFREQLDGTLDAMPPESA